MSMTPQDTLNEQIWEILQDIKEEYLITEKLEYVKFHIPNVVGVGIILPDTRVSILRKLQECGAVKIKTQYAYRYYISVNDKKFDELYEKYKQINSSKKDLPPTQAHDSALQETIDSLAKKLAEKNKIDKANQIKDLSSKMHLRPAWEELNDWGAKENLIKEIKGKRGDDFTIKPSNTTTNISKEDNLRRWCNYDYKTRTLTIRQNDGQIVALTFRKHKRRISFQCILFEVGYELWLEEKLPVERGELIRVCRDKVASHGLSIEANSMWLKQTLRNLRGTIKDSQVRGYIMPFDIDEKKRNSYSFIISSSSNGA